MLTHLPRPARLGRLLAVRDDRAGAGDRDLRMEGIGRGGGGPLIAQRASGVFRGSGDRRLPPCSSAGSLDAAVAQRAVARRRDCSSAVHNSGMPSPARTRLDPRKKNSLMPNSRARSPSPGFQAQKSGGRSECGCMQGGVGGHSRRQDPVRGTSGRAAAGSGCGREAAAALLSSSGMRGSRPCTASPAPTAPAAPRHLCTGLRANGQEECGMRHMSTTSTLTVQTAEPCHLDASKVRTAEHASPIATAVRAP